MLERHRVSVSLEMWTRTLQHNVHLHGLHMLKYPPENNHKISYQMGSWENHQLKHALGGDSSQEGKLEYA